MKSAKTLLIVELVIKEIVRRIYSNEIFYCLHFDLSQNVIIPELPVALTIKKLQMDDFFKIIHLNKGTTSDELKGHIERTKLFYSEIPTCYAAYSDDVNPCAFCWLIRYYENDKIKKYFKGNILDLKSDEVLCEYIYIHHNYRSLDLMAYLTYKLFEIAAQNGAKRAIAYVKDSNKRSLKGCKRIGWKPFLIKEVKFRFFKRLVSYRKNLPDSVYFS